VGRAGSNTCTYDCTGNVTRRVISETQVVTYYQEHDAENRLVAAMNTISSLVTRFAYDRVIFPPPSPGSPGRSPAPGARGRWTLRACAGT